MQTDDLVFNRHATFKQSLKIYSASNFWHSFTYYVHYLLFRQRNFSTEKLQGSKLFIIQSNETSFVSLFPDLTNVIFNIFSLLCRNLALSMFLS